jgi:hypothetical protein
LQKIFIQLQILRRDHERHFNILERLENTRGNNSACHSIETFIADHYLCEDNNKNDEFSNINNVIVTNINEGSYKKKIKISISVNNKYIELSLKKRTKSKSKNKNENENCN